MKTKMGLVPKLLLTLLILAVAGAVVASFFVLGSPGSERSRRYDEQRVSHLQNLASTIDIFWTNEKRLPASLDELRMARNYYVDGLLDPATGEPYEYRKVSDTSYELCTTFDAEADGSERAAIYSAPLTKRSETFWSHSAGHVCFTIEPLEIPYQTPIEVPRPIAD